VHEKAATLFKLAPHGLAGGIWCLIIRIMHMASGGAATVAGFGK
jgi:hypothetical protein